MKIRQLENNTYRMYSVVFIVLNVLAILYFIAFVYDSVETYHTLLGLRRVHVSFSDFMTNLPTLFITMYEQTTTFWIAIGSLPVTTLLNIWFHRCYKIKENGPYKPLQTTEK